MLVCVVQSGGSARTAGGNVFFGGLNELMVTISHLNSRIALRYRCPLEPRKIFKYGSRWLLKALLAWIIIAGCLIWTWSIGKPEQPFSYHIFDHLPLLSCLGVVFTILAFLHPTLYFLSYFYDVDDKNVIIRKGVLAKREIILPFSRITDINVEQDWLDVLLGLYDIHISTPTSESGKFAHIDGVNKISAGVIRQILIDRINSISYEREPISELRLAKVA